MAARTSPDGPDDIDQDLTAEIVASLRSIAATYGRRPTDVGAERSRRWTQLADDVANGRLRQLDREQLNATDTATEVAK